MADEFYGRHMVKPSLMLLRPTKASTEWLRSFLLWLWTYPFGHEARVSALIHQNSSKNRPP